MGEMAYKKYVERGPDALPLEETKAALGPGQDTISRHSARAIVV